MKIDYSGAFFDKVNDIISNNIMSCYSGNIDGMYGGYEVRQLEIEISQKFNSKYAITCNSATSGLYIALLASCGFGNGEEEVIVTPYSMTCSATVPLLLNYKPVFADIEKDYFCLDPESIREKITEKTKAIIVVDLFGQPYEMEEINKIAKENNIVVIEDAAQAIGSMYKDKFAGTLGDIGVLSFNQHKHINCGEGGMILTNDNLLADECRLAMNHGEAIINDAFLKEENKLNSDLFTESIGLNLRLTEIQAAIIRYQLDKLDDILKYYRENALPFPVKVRPNCLHSFYRYAFLKTYENSYIDPDEIGNELYEEYNLKKGYITPLYKFPIFKHLGYKTVLQNVEWVQNNIILAWNKGCG